MNVRFRGLSQGLQNGVQVDLPGYLPLSLYLHPSLQFPVYRPSVSFSLTANMVPPVSRGKKVKATDNSRQTAPPAHWPEV